MNLLNASGTHEEKMFFTAFVTKIKWTSSAVYTENLKFVSRKLEFLF